MNKENKGQHSATEGGTNIEMAVDLDSSGVSSDLRQLEQHVIGVVLVEGAF